MIYTSGTTPPEEGVKSFFERGYLRYQFFTLFYISFLGIVTHSAFKNCSRHARLHWASHIRFRFFDALRQTARILLLI